MIYLSANRLRYSCFAIVINYSHCKEHCVFKTKRHLYPVDFLCTKKGKSLSRIQIRNFEVMVTHKDCVSSLWCVPPCSPNRDPIHFEFVYYSSFLSIPLGTEITNTFIHSRSSIENDTRFQTKMGKMQTRFQTKTAKIYIYPSGRHIPIWLI